MYLVYVFRFSHRQKDLKNTVRNSYLQKLYFWWCAHVPLILHTHTEKEKCLSHYFKIFLNYLFKRNRSGDHSFKLDAVAL